VVVKVKKIFIVKGREENCLSNFKQPTSERGTTLGKSGVDERIINN
jgi:hypothetical protein